MTTRVLAYTCLVFALVTLIGCEHKPYDEKMISDDKEFDYLGSNKRGIRGDDGTIYYVDKDGVTLSAYKGDAVKWHATFGAGCGGSDEEDVELLYMSLDGNEIFLIFGAVNGNHHSAKIDIRNGKVRIKCAEKDSQPL